MTATIPKTERLNGMGDNRPHQNQKIVPNRLAPTTSTRVSVRPARKRRPSGATNSPSVGGSGAAPVGNRTRISMGGLSSNGSPRIISSSSVGAPSSCITSSADSSNERSSRGGSSSPYTMAGSPTSQSTLESLSFGIPSPSTNE